MPRTNPSATVGRFLVERELPATLSLWPEKISVWHPLSTHVDIDSASTALLSQPDRDFTVRLVKVLAVNRSADRPSGAPVGPRSSVA